MGLIVTLDVIQSINLSLDGSNRQPKFVKSIRIKNDGVARRNLQLKLHSDPNYLEFAHPIYYDYLNADQVIEITDFARKLEIDYASLSNQSFDISCTLQAELLNEDKIPIASSEKKKITIRPFNYWPGQNYESLAAFVIPNSSNAIKLRVKTNEQLRHWGWPSTLPERKITSRKEHREVAAAVFESVKALHISPVEISSDYGKNGLYIGLLNPADEKLKGSSLDLCILFASVFESLSLKPFLIISENQAFVGIWVHDNPMMATTSNDTDKLLNQIAAEKAVVFNPIGVTVSKKSTYLDSEEDALDYLNANECIVVDIEECRNTISPLNLSNIISEDSDRRTGFSSNRAGISITHTPSVGKMGMWERKLLNMNLRNNLLNIHKTQDKLPLLISDVTQFAADFIDGAEYTILDNTVDYVLPGNLNENIFEITDKLKPFDKQIKDRLKKRAISTPLSLVDVKKSLYSIYRGYKSTLEETGSNSLHLVINYLRWADDDGLTHYAPLILIPIDIIRKNTKQYVIRANGEDPTFNETILEYVSRFYGIDLLSEYDDRSESSEIDIDAIVATVSNKLSELPGWRVINSALIGNFSFYEFVMWKDLKERGELIKDSPVVLSLVSGQLTWIPREIENDYDPNDCLLIEKADASQIVAVNAANENNTFLIQGPPGTGKSQTITNMIATILSQGKTVLFVAEKSEALEVVYRRLREAGLGDYCLEMHSKKTDKGAVLKKLYSNFENSEDRYCKRELYRLNKLEDSIEEYHEALYSKTSLGIPLVDLIAEYESLQPTNSQIQVKEISSTKLNEKTLSLLDECIDLLKKYRLEIVTLRNSEFKELRLPRYNPDIAEELIELSEKYKSFDDRFTSLKSKIGSIHNLVDLNNLTAAISAYNKSFRSDAVSNNTIVDLETLRSIESDLEDWSIQLSKTNVLKEDGLLSLSIIQTVQDDIKRLLECNLEVPNGLRTLETEFNNTKTLIETLNEKPRYPSFKVYTTKETFDNDELKLIALPNHLKLSQSAIDKLEEELQFYQECRTSDIRNISSFNTNSLASIEHVKKMSEAVSDTLLILMCQTNYASIIEDIQKSVDTKTPVDRYISKLDNCTGLDKLTILNDFEQYFENMVRSTEKIIVTDLDVVKEPLLHMKDQYEEICLQSPSLKKYLDLVKDWNSNIFAQLPNLSQLSNEYKNAGFLKKSKARKSLQNALQNVYYGDVSAIDSIIPQLNRLIECDVVIRQFGESVSRFIEYYKQYIAACEAVLSEITQFNEISGENSSPFIASAIREYRDNKGALSAFETALSTLETDLHNILKIPTNYEIGSKFDFKVIVDCISEVAQYLTWASEYTDKIDEAKKLRAGQQTLQKFIDALNKRNKAISTFETYGLNETNIQSIFNCSEAEQILEGYSETEAELSRDYPELYDQFSYDPSTIFNLICGNAGILDDVIHARTVLEEVSEKGFPKLVELLMSDEDIDSCYISYKRAIFEKAIQKSFATYRNLKSFDHEYYESLIEDYKNEYEEYIINNREWLTSKIESNIYEQLHRYSDEFTTAIRDLTHYAQLKRLRVSLRTIFSKLREIITILTPCVLMSPVSVAQFLDPAMDKFDYIIFDEASQIPTHMAVGALARGEHAIIAGDRKQLPPTTFFTNASGIETDSDDEEAIPEDSESVLDQCTELRIPQKNLLWHYRSSHESLIAFSNEEFYGNSLLTFPSPNDRERKVRFEKVNGTFTWGKGKKNVIEAKAVAQEVIRLLKDKKTANLSIGVIAFGTSQKDAIQDQLDNYFDEYPSLYTKAYDRSAPLFVKNLERVQGDERDIIIISVGYARGPDGVLKKFFGPLSQEGGWRRLNVAVTRARMEMVVFSSISYTDFANQPVSGSARSFVDFLKYAETGSLTDSTSEHETNKAKLSTLISDELKQRGYSTQLEVGHSGYKVDLAIVDPTDSQNYVLGILTDGDNYNNANNTRDRAFAQYDMLRRLGWNLFRVWSVEWYLDKESVCSRIIDTLKELVETKPSCTEKQPEINHDPQPAIETPIQEPKAIPSNDSNKFFVGFNRIPYKKAVITPTNSFDDILDNVKYTPELIKLIQDIIRLEAPISGPLLLKRFAESLGMEVTGLLRLRFNTLMHGLTNLQTTKSIDEKNIIYWGCGGANPKGYKNYRYGELKERYPGEFSIQELSNAIIDNYSPAKTKEEIIQQAMYCIGYTESNITQELRRLMNKAYSAALNWIQMITKMRETNPNLIY